MFRCNFQCFLTHYHIYKKEFEGCLKFLTKMRYSRPPRHEMSKAAFTRRLKILNLFDCLISKEIFKRNERSPFLHKFVDNLLCLQTVFSVCFGARLISLNFPYKIQKC